MANNYLEFSEVLPHLTAEEETWLRSQLERVYVFGNREFTEHELPSDLDAADADWHGCRAWRDLEGCQPDDREWVGFEYEFVDDDRELPDGWGRHLWLYTQEGGGLERIAHLVQKLLRQFRPRDCWSLTYATTCSKPRVGEFGGGAVFVTADEVKWQNAHDFVETQSEAFRKKTASREDESRNERLVWIEMLAAYENHVWDTISVQVPMSVVFDDEQLSPRAIVDYVEDNLAGQAQYRHVVAWAFYSFDEDQFQNAEEQVP